MQKMRDYLHGRGAPLPQMRRAGDRQRRHFRRAASDGSKRRARPEPAPQQKRAQSSLAIPLPFAVIVIGLLLNPAAHGWLSRICMICQPPMHIFYALQFGLNCIGLVAVVTILDASRRAHRGGLLLKGVAVILILLTIFGMADSFLAVEKSISRLAGL